jgi:hypothetical protein
LSETGVPDLGAPDVPDCPLCDRPFIRTLIRFEFRRILFGYFPADVCEGGHEFLTDESGEAIEEIAKRMGVFGSRAPRARTRVKARSVGGS